MAQEAREGGLNLVSVESQAALQSGPDAAARRRSSFSLYISLGLLWIVILLLISGYLVRLDNDHNHHSVLPGSVPAGGAATGELTLTNSGWLPIEVTLQPKLGDGSTPASIPATLTMTIQTVSGGGLTIYSGPLRTSMGPFLILQPGEAEKLHLEVRSTDSSTGAVPLAYTYYWNARPAVPWWWWIPVVLLMALIAAGGYWRPGRRRATA